MTISCGHTPVKHSALICHNIQREDVSYHKHLDITLRDGLSWSNHIDGILGNKLINILTGL